MMPNTVELQVHQSIPDRRTRPTRHNGQQVCAAVTQMLMKKPRTRNELATLLDMTYSAVDKACQALADEGLANVTVLDPAQAGNGQVLIYSWKDC